MTRRGHAPSDDASPPDEALPQPRTSATQASAVPAWKVNDSWK